MADTKADAAAKKKAEAEANHGQPVPVPEVTPAQAKKSAAEAEKLPSASAPAVASEAEAKRAETTLTAGEVDKLEGKNGDLGPFRDTASPVGAALDATTRPDTIDTSLDFDEEGAFTEAVGDTVVSVRKQNSRNVVEISLAGWNGPGFIVAPYQAKLLHEALGNVVKKLKKH